MSQEEMIKEKLINRFSFLEGSITIPRQRRISLEVKQENFLEVFEYAKKELDFPHLCTITGLDDGKNLSFIYHLAQDSGILLNLKISVPKENPVLKTVTAHFAGAEIYERELVDLLGAKVEGLSEDNRYPLTDDWPVGQYPLRKDWKSETERKAGE